MNSRSKQRNSFLSVSMDWIFRNARAKQSARQIYISITCEKQVRGNVFNFYMYLMHICVLNPTDIMYLLTEWKDRKGKYLARPNSVSKHFISQTEPRDCISSTSRARDYDKKYSTIKACQFFLTIGIRQEMAHNSSNKKTHCLIHVFLYI